MPNFRCEFEVKGDLVVPQGLPEIVFSTVGEITTKLRNGPLDGDGQISGLEAIVYGPADSIETARETLQGALSWQLDLMAFVTDSRFRIITPRRLFEWEAGSSARRFHFYHPIDPRHPPAQGLTSELIATLTAIDHAAPPPFVRKSLKYFRYGVLGDDSEDQFMRFWLALEIIAENLKESTPIAMQCPACSAPIECHSCGVKPTRVPMAKQAIEELIKKLAGERAQDMSKPLLKARNALMHGGSRERVEADCKIPLHELVNALGAIAWDAIWSAIPKQDGKDYAFFERLNDLAAKTVYGIAKGSYGYPGHEEQPPDNQLPIMGMNVQAAPANTPNL